MNIVVSSRWWPVSFSRYFLPALKRTGHKIITVGPWTGKWIRWNKGMELDIPEALCGLPDIVSNSNFSMFQPISEVENQIDFPVDLWLHINSDFCLAGKPRHGIVASVFVDSPTQNYDLERTWSDFSFNMQKAWCKDGDTWLPFAYSRDFHYPLKRKEPFEYDISHLGVLGKARAVFAELARSRGMKIRFETGPAYDQLRTIYKDSRVCFSWSTRGELVGRVFEALSMGIPLLTDRISPENGLWELGLHENTHFKAFSDLSEALSMAKYMLNHYDEQKEMAERGRREVPGNSYDERVKTILETVGFSGTV